MADQSSISPGPLRGWLLMHRSMVRTGPLRMLTRRNLDAAMVTMRSAGSHWLQWMLLQAMHEAYGLPLPEHVNDQSIIGTVSDFPAHHDGPRLIRTHNEMPVPLYAILNRFVRFPKYIILMRDIRHSLVSYFEKDAADARDASFSEFLRGKDGIFKADHVLFRHIRFLNSWASVRKITSDRCLVVKYEDLRSSAATELERVWRFLELKEPAEGLFDRAVAESTKDKMSAKETVGDTRPAVRKSNRNPLDWYSDADEAYVRQALKQFLVDDYGYDYEDWSSRTPAESATGLVEYQTQQVKS
ncbi:MAG: sulfotransferase domain-containing protein [Planctomycetota bacterium]